jgi:hypothetical protein
MSDIQAAGTIVLFFALRCIAPIVITIGIGYLMNRLVARWEAEEAAEKEVVTGIKPATPTVGKAGSTSRKLPCWIVRNCDEGRRANCPAYQNQSLPCWIARLLSEGVQPSSCPDCPVYDPTLATT